MNTIATKLEPIPLQDGTYACAYAQAGCDRTFVDRSAAWGHVAQCRLNPDTRRRAASIISPPLPPLGGREGGPTSLPHSAAIGVEQAATPSPVAETSDDPADSAATPTRAVTRRFRPSHHQSMHNSDSAYPPTFLPVAPPPHPKPWFHNPAVAVGVLVLAGGVGFFLGWIVGRSEKVGERRALDEAGAAVGAAVKDGANQFIRQGFTTAGKAFWPRALGAARRGGR